MHYVPNTEPNRTETAWTGTAHEMNRAHSKYYEPKPNRTEPNIHIVGQTFRSSSLKPEALDTPASVAPQRVMAPHRKCWEYMEMGVSINGGTPKMDG